MQSNYKDIYKKTAERTGKPENMYKDIGNFVFAALYRSLRRPKTLIVRLKGVGKWYLRRKRMTDLLTLYPLQEKTEFKDENALWKYENRQEIHNIFKERLKDYEQFVDEKLTIRKKRYETQHILESKEDS